MQLIFNDCTLYSQRFASTVSCIPIFWVASDNPFCRQIIQDAIALRQAKLDRLKASAAEHKASDTRPNMRRKDVEDSTSLQEPSETVEPKAKRPKVGIVSSG